MNPAKSIALWLEAQALGSTTADADTWLIRYGQRVDSTQPMVTVYDTAGNVPSGEHDGGTTRKPSVQILVSGAKGNVGGEYDRVRTQAEAIYTAASLNTVGSGDSFLAYPSSEILSLGFDEQGRPEMSLNMNLRVVS